MPDPVGTTRTTPASQPPAGRPPHLFGPAVGHTGGVSGIDRVDRIIGVTVVVVLAALAGLGLSDNSRAASPSASRPLSAPTTVPASGGTPLLTAPSADPSTSVPTTTTTTPGPVPGPVTAVGDSVMLDIQPQLTADLPGVTVDGLVSRQFDAGTGVVQTDRASGTLGRVLVVELGTNGPITPSGIDAMMRAASGVTRVVFVNVCVPRDWAASDNSVLAAGVARYPGLAALADWNALATPHPEWFTADRVHLNPAGATALAALIAQYA